MGWFTQMLETRFNIQRAFRSVSQFLFFFHPWGSFPPVNPKDSSCWIVCRSFPFFFDKTLWSMFDFRSSSIPNFHRPLCIGSVMSVLYFFLSAEQLGLQAPLLLVYCTSKSLLPTIGRLDPRVPPGFVLLYSTVKLAPLARAF